MADIELVIKIPKEIIKDAKDSPNYYPSYLFGKIWKAVANGTVLPEGHGRLKDEDEIIKAIEDRVEFLRKNDAVFMRLRKDIDILGCIPKIRCEVPIIIEADRNEEWI